MSKNNNYFYKTLAMSNDIIFRGAGGQKVGERPRAGGQKVGGKWSYLALPVSMNMILIIVLIIW